MTDHSKYMVMAIRVSSTEGAAVAWTCEGRLFQEHVARDPKFWDRLGFLIEEQGVDVLLWDNADLLWGEDVLESLDIDENITVIRKDFLSLQEDDWKLAHNRFLFESVGAILYVMRTGYR